METSVVNLYDQFLSHVDGLSEGLETRESAAPGDHPFIYTSTCLSLSCVSLSTLSLLSLSLLSLSLLSLSPVFLRLALKPWCQRQERERRERERGRERERESEALHRD